MANEILKKLQKHVILTTIIIMSKNIFSIIILIIVVGASVFWGVYTLRGQKQPSISFPASSQYRDGTSSSTETNFTVSAENTIDWKTYRSEKYQYEVKYPNNFEVNEYFYPQTPDGVFCDNLNGVDKEFDQTKAGEGIKEEKILSFQIHVDPTPRCMQIIISHYSSQLSGEPLPSKYLGSENVIINGRKFIKENYLEVLTEPEYRIAGEQAYKFSIFSLLANDKTYIFSYWHTKGGENLIIENEFKKILSTFKFIKQ